MTTASISGSPKDRRVVDRSNGDPEPLGPTLVQVRAGDRLDECLGHGMDQVLGVHPADATCADHAHRGGS